jgi:hypothetical protein
VAGDLTETATAAPEPARERGLVLHRRRFLVLYALVGGAAVAGVLGFLLLVGGGPLSKSDPPWSAWKPHGGGLGAAREIAQHVGGGYRLPDGTQFVDVIAKEPSVRTTGTIPISFFSVRGRKGVGDTLVPVSSSDSMTFSLCGLGQACSIPTGKPSPAREIIVRREILELALYTFKYVGGVKNVVAFPPTVKGKVPYAVYLQKSDLSQQLKLPLVRTLSAEVPLPSTIAPREWQMIDLVLSPRIYAPSVTRSQQGDLVLVLRPFKAK